MPTTYEVRLEVKTEESAARLVSILAMNSYWVYSKPPVTAGNPYVVLVRLTEKEVTEEPWGEENKDND